MRSITRFEGDNKGAQFSRTGLIFKLISLDIVEFTRDESYENKVKFFVGGLYNSVFLEAQAKEATYTKAAHRLR